MIPGIFSFHRKVNSRIIIFPKTMSDEARRGITTNSKGTDKASPSSTYSMLLRPEDAAAAGDPASPFLAFKNLIPSVMGLPIYFTEERTVAAIAAVYLDVSQAVSS